MTPDVAIVIIIIAALPYADRWITAHYADRAAARRQAAKTTGGEK